MAAPMRGFEQSEFCQRVTRAQKLMQARGLDGLLLTSEAEFRYFSGFLTRFWQSPTRPWFLIVPANGDPVAVIPSIGEQLMRTTWIADIRTWNAPCVEDDGVSLLADTLAELIGQKANLGIPMGHESHVRMPLGDFDRLRRLIQPLELCDDGGIIRKLRMVKSAAEIKKITWACEIAGRAFDRVGEIAAENVSLEQVFRKFQILCLEEGADWVPYLAGGAGQSGYSDVISPATPRLLVKGDVLMLDTGLVWDGYFCDYDRNFSVGVPQKKASDGHAQLLDATRAGLEAAKPGATAADVYYAMSNITRTGKSSSDGGRLGHGLGMQLTEWPSFTAQDKTMLVDGMVLTLEPYIQTGENKIMVHEENIVIGADGARLISPMAAPRLVEL